MSGAVQAGYAPPTGPDQPARGRRWLRWLLAATVAWGVLLAGLVWWSVRHDPPTVREQRPISRAVPVVDRAVGQLVAAIGDGAWALTPPAFSKGCRITPMADGASLVRGVDVLVADGGERAVLERVAGRLPADWRAEVGGAGPRLRADAGEFVAVRGWLVEAGRVRLTADTGCRPADAEYGDLLPGYPHDPALDEALTALGRPVVDPSGRIVAPCPGGGHAQTVPVTGGPAPVPLAALRSLAAGAVVVDRPEVYAYRRGSAVVVVDATGPEVQLTASTGCAG